MNRHFLTALFAALGVSLSNAQSTTRPVFEVASLRPHPGPARGILIKLWLPTFQCPPRRNCGILGNRFREESVTLADLIMDAYKVKNFQIAGLPAWGNSQSYMYDLDAKVEGEGPPTVDQVRLMLQAFLADRFRLRIHNENRLLPVYALMPAKKGVRLIPSKAPCLARPGQKDVPTTARQSDDPRLPWSFDVEQVAARAERPVINKTELDVESGYCTVDGENPLLAVLFDMYSGDRVSVFTAVEEKWGMKLESDKAPVDVMVVDQVERPSGN
jgi:uncharacterized protein (TIGR03435 family)